MKSESDDIPPPEDELDDFEVDTRTLHTDQAIFMLHKYLEVMEAQMEEVHRCERVELEAERPSDADDPRDLEDFSDRQASLDYWFECELTPAMRYSFIVLLHIMFETQLRAFCAGLEHHQEIPISLKHVSGSAIERVRTYITKLAGIQIGEIPEWEHLRMLQKIRDCIVHAYGYVTERGHEDEKFLRQLATKNIGIGVDEDGRLTLTKAFCDQNLSYLDSFFGKLFEHLGWKRSELDFDWQCGNAPAADPRAIDDIASESF